MCLSQAWLCLFALANSMQDLFFFFLSFFVIVWFLVFQDIVGRGVGHKMLPPGITALRWGKVSRFEAAQRKGCQLRQGACQGPDLLSVLAHSPSSGPSLLAPHQCVFRAPL